MKLDALLETPHCPVCASDVFEVVYPARYPSDWSVEAVTNAYSSASDHELLDQLVKCSVCGVGYLRPRLAPDLIVASYSEAEDETFVAQNPERIATFERNFGRMMKLLGVTAGRGASVLDVGCAGGAFLAAARTLGFAAIGIEPSRWMCDFAQREYGVDARQGTLEEQSFEENSFDVVTLWDVLEHVPEPRETLAEIHRVLKPGGHLLVTYPDRGTWLARLLGRKWPFLLSVHLTYYTRATIKRQLEQAGFVVDFRRPYWQGLKLSYVLRRAARYFAMLQPIEKLITNTGLGNVQVRYFMGQFLVAAHKQVGPAGPGAGERLEE